MAEIATQSPPPLIGQSRAFLAVLEHVSAVAPLNRPVLLVGERGTGKELLAARLHYLSPRWRQPFVKLNCAALPESLLDAELFGHEAGAFTGAVRRRAGRFELADGGTLFLDEIANAAPQVQEKILRAVEYGEFERVGGVETLRVDVRLVAATNADLPRLAAKGGFRPDLLDRLAFDVVTLPPLRARPEDVAVLAEHFALGLTRELGRDFFAGFAPAARDALLNHSWPGNVRELRNVVERAVALSAPDRPVADVVLDPFASPWRPGPPPSTAAPPEPEPAGDFAARVAACEVRLLRQALAESRFNQKQAAERLGLSYHQFRRLLRKHGLGVSSPAAI